MNRKLIFDNIMYSELDMYVVRVSSKILSWGGGGEQDGDCSCTRKRVCLRGGSGAMPPRKILNLDPLRLLLGQDCCQIPVTTP